MYTYRSLVAVATLMFCYPGLASIQPQLSNQSKILKLEQKLRQIETDNGLLSTQIELEKQAMSMAKSSEEKTKHETAMNDLIAKRKQNIDQYDAAEKEIEFLKNAESTVQTLKSKGFVSESARVEKVVNPSSSAAEAIIFIKDKNTCPVVAKIFKTVDDFVKEHKKVTKDVAYAELVSELSKKCGLKLPIIVSSTGGINIDGVGVFLLGRAEGKSLTEYINMIPTMPDDKIKDIFTKIGEQFGDLDSLVLQNNKGEIIYNKDSHGGNYFFDEAHDQLYWIDTSGAIGLVSEVTDNGMAKLRFFSKQLLRGISLSYVPRKEPNAPETVVFYKNVRKHLMASQAFAQGYYNKNKKDSVKLFYNNRAAEAVKVRDLINEVNQYYVTNKINVAPLDFDRDFAVK